MNLDANQLRELPLPKETLMELPEFSFEQELLSISIPFSARVSLLSDYDTVAPCELTVSEIAARTGRDRNTTQVSIKHLAPSSREVLGVLRYEPFVAEVIEEELAWQAQVEELDQYVSAIQLGSLLSKRPQWIHEKAAALSVDPIVRTIESGQVVRLYPKRTVEALRHIVLLEPRAEDWVSQAKIMSQIGRSLNWLNMIVEKEELPFEARLDAATGNMRRHFPPSVAEKIVALASQYERGGDWLPVSVIAERLGRDIGWVQARLEPFSDLCEVRLPIGGRPVMHYPSHVVDALNESFGQTPQAETWLTIGNFASQLGKSSKWVKLRLNREFGEGELRCFPTGHERRCYPPEALDFLLSQL